MEIRKRMDDKNIDQAIVFIKELFHTNAGGHDSAHTMRVYKNTLRIAEQEADCDVQTACLAALLHDADDHKLFHTENNTNARSFLNEQQVPAALINQICDIINSVSFSRNHGKAPETPEGKVVQESI